MSAFSKDECDILAISKDAFLDDDWINPPKQCVALCLAVVVVTLLVSSVTGNYSQVDKIWSIIPFCYAWLVVCDERTLLMAVVSTIWGCRLTWNFNRRGGYKWPPWDGDEDYRWKYLQDGFVFSVLANKAAWILFNIFFISIYQNLLLLWIASPAIVAYLVSTSCDVAPLNGYDYAAAISVVVFVILEGIADNQQYAFQTEKYRLRDTGKKLEGEYADGFLQSGLFSIVRKPNYSSEQSIWISFYLFSIGAVQGQQFLNWSVLGSILLPLLFVGSGYFTECITLTKYPNYKEYMKTTPLYVPNPFQIFRQSKEKRQ